MTSRAGIHKMDGTSLRWPRGRRGVWSPGRGGAGKRGRMYRVQVHVLPFVDHAGQPAVMAFRGRTLCPLPPLYSYAFYLTHPAASPATVDAAALYHALDESMNNEPYRIELYFVPSGSQDDCIAHARREKAKRGDYAAQQADADALSSDFEDIPEDDEEAGWDKPGARLPGCVPSYSSGMIHTYHGRLGIVDEHPGRPVAEWKAGRVEFDPVEQSGDEEAEEEEETAPPVFTQECSLKQIGTSIYVPQETIGSWQKAVNYNWKSW